MSPLGRFPSAVLAPTADPGLKAPPARRTGSLGLRTDRVSWGVDGRLILDDVAVDVPPGTVTGVLGPNGAGKSTLLRVIAGVQRPDGGTVTLTSAGSLNDRGPLNDRGSLNDKGPLNEEVPLDSRVPPTSADDADLLGMPRRRRARILALVEQDAVTDLPLTASDAVLLGRIPHRSPLAGDSAADRAVAEAALARTGATHLADRLVATLSGGERQRVHLARARCTRWRRSPASCCSTSRPTTSTSRRSSPPWPWCAGSPTTASLSSPRCTTSRWPRRRATTSSCSPRGSPVSPAVASSQPAGSRTSSCRRSWTPSTGYAPRCCGTR